MFSIPKKASAIACLFYLSAVFNHACGQDFTFSSSALKAYQHTLNFEFSTSQTLITSDNTEGASYVRSLNEALELLLTEDPEKFDRYETRFEERLRSQPTTALDRFVQAEMNLQWAFVYLKFGHELDAASHFRDAYKLAFDCRKRYPQFAAIRKTTGLLQVMVGAVPNKYNWVMELFGMKGSITEGLSDLQAVIDSSPALRSETLVLKSLVEGYVLQQPGSAAAVLEQLSGTDSLQAISFAAASLLVKAAQSEKAFVLLTKSKPVTPLQQYLLAEVLLHRGDYAYAISFYKDFIAGYKGENNVKDAAYKTGVCYRLSGNAKRADSAFVLARKIGRETVEADRSAARTLQSAEQANVNLLRARYFTDGGYYDLARSAVTAIPERELISPKDKVEYFYRRARIEHGSNHIPSAKLFYQQVIDMPGGESWYFAPNACLQMGYLMLNEKNEAEARTYFRKALTYKNHEYKNSIDSKAKTALNRLRK